MHQYWTIHFQLLAVEKNQFLHKPDRFFCHLQLNAFLTCTIILLTIRFILIFKKEKKWKKLDLSRLIYSSILLKLKREVWKNSTCTWKKMCKYDIKDGISTMITITIKCLLHSFASFWEKLINFFNFLFSHPIVLITVSSFLKPH